MFVNLNEVTVMGADVVVPVKDPYGLLFSNCTHFRLTGSKITGGNIGVSVGKGCTDFEIDHNVITSSGFAGLMAKDDGAKRGEFIMRNVKIHHNYVENTGAEGFYIGNSSFDKGHDLVGVWIFSNTFNGTGWDAIQAGCSTDCKIFDNIIDNAGTKKEKFQGNGIQLGKGTTALCYGNVIRKTSGNGIISLGKDCEIFENVILFAGDNGIFIDDRLPMGTWNKIFKNVIVKPAMDCLSISANHGVQNEAWDNLLLMPGSYGKVTGRDSFIRILSDVLLKESNNRKSMDESEAAYYTERYKA
jgi:hypothetical protein